MIKNFILLVIVFFIALIVCKNCYANDTFYGVGVWGGEQCRSASFIHVSESYDWTEIQVRPVYGWHLDNRWDAWLEGEIGYIQWNEGSGYKLGVMVLTGYDVIKGNNWSLFGEVGVGLGYNSYSPSRNTLGNNPTGLIDVGIGVEYKNIRLGPRFHHTSSFFGHDAGINTFGTMLTVRF